MIRIVRPELAQELADRLPPLTAEIANATDTANTARLLWKRTQVRRTVHAPLRKVLADMAPGIECCMYCGDSQGTDIDHFEPLVLNPLRTFDWLNHLLACSTCNSHNKGSFFPLDSDGTPLLIDPTVEDPFDHLVLTPSLGVYHGLTPKGLTTIEVCALNRSTLTRGRQQAHRVVLMCLEKWADAYENDMAADMHEAVITVREQPFADVCQSLLRLALSPGASRVFDDPHVLDLLRRPELREALLT
ncbi:HNH endonuclease [Umezawaea sp. Da 62-37]|uniref:HNH endonuclease n=1 Tax=Umezawaea sp. Da 62-37 TaxID=3075927 RepID=UPI0028F6CC0D|nr:HNH endonuclease [Umezawaea sp. Da 62-37]WNV83660.1 HNH endonuclease [Umezawaea sp. Da 62-37]